MSDEKKCGLCGAPLAAGTPEGLCPACLLKRALETQTAGGGLGAGFTPPSPEELGRFFPQLEILELLGRGGMGVVYKARQRDLDRIVALKILPSATDRDPAFAERFAREARALARLGHPNIVAIYESGQAGGLFYFVMEYVDGLNLRQLLAAAKMTPREALAIVPQICEALQTAHDQGIVHRDIKPENILLDKKGRVKIADFGIAKIVGADGKDMTLTGAGEMMGTPAYMAPEQIEHPQDVDHRADIYSLGVVFYQMLTGELPLGKFSPPSRIRGMQIDVRLDEVVLRALEKEPELRYQQASEVRTHVETIAGTPGQDRPDANAQRADPSRLNRIRFQIIGYSFLMAVGAVVMAVNIIPLRYGMVVGSWGVLFFLAASVIAFAAGDSMDKLRAAGQVALIDSIGIFAAAMKCAFLSPELHGPWMIPIVAACGYGIVSGVLKLANLRPFGSGAPAGHHEAKTPAPSQLASVALFFSGLSGVLVWVTFFFLWNPPAILAWAALAMALAGILPAIPARAHWWGKLALLVGIINANAVIWLIPWTSLPESLSAHPIPELSQDETLDIQPDGAARFKITSSYINRLHASVDRDDFNISNGFLVERITDAHGSPVHFDAEQKTPNLCHYTEVLNEPIPHGGLITTTIEGDVSNLVKPAGDPGVFEYDFDHSPGYDGMTHRVELHRLPPGAELIDKSPDDLKVESAGDHIELRIDRRIPPGGDLDVRYRYRLANANLQKEPGSATPSKETQAIVNIKSDGSIVFNHHLISGEELVARLRELETLFPDQAIIIRADENTNYQFIVKILDLCRQAKIWNVAFPTQFETQPSAPTGAPARAASPESSGTSH